MGDPRVCARGHLEPPGTLCLCTDGSETRRIFPVEGKVWVGREEVILHLWPICISHKFLDAAAAAVLGSTILWEVLLRMRASKVVQW